MQVSLSNRLDCIDEGSYYVLVTVILMHTLSECRGFEESCVLIHSLFLDFPPQITEL